MVTLEQIRKDMEAQFALDSAIQSVEVNADTLDEALEGIDRYVEEHPYEYYVNNYQKGRYVIDLYEYEIKNNWIIEEDSD